MLTRSKFKRFAGSYGQRHYWITADTLTIFQIALLMAGYDPSDFEGTSINNWTKSAVESTKVHISSTKNAVTAHKLSAVSIAHYEYGGIGQDERSIDVGELRDWFESRGIYNSVFHAKPPNFDGFDNPGSQFYAPKLAAAVDAWRAVTAESKWLRGKSPKQALQAWLAENAASYGLADKDGKPNTTGIEEIAKVANWKPSGGAPTTPQVLTEPPPSLTRTIPRVAGNLTYGSDDPYPDDDIPF